jgi:peptidoglycan/LPS O-acetylase OafA/YrhL
LGVFKKSFAASIMLMRNWNKKSFSLINSPVADGEHFHPKIGYLEGIRGLAAVSVFFYHYFLAFLPALITSARVHKHAQGDAELILAHSLLNVTWNGNFAVLIFFVLSGMVLSWRFFESDFSIPVGGAVKRWLRLVIPVLISTLLAWLLAVSGLFANKQVAAISGSGFWFGELWKMPASFSDSFIEGIYGALVSGKPVHYNPVLWTMNLEFYGSLLVFAFLALFGRLKKRLLIYIILAFLFHKSMFLAFIWGVAIADLAHHPFRKKIPAVFSVLLIFAGLYLGGYTETPGDHPWSWLRDAGWKPGPAQIAIVGAGLLLTGISNWTYIQRLLMHRWLIFLGRISFSLYLLHVIFLGTAASQVFILFIRAEVDYFLTCTIVICGSFVCLLLICRYYEKWIDRSAIRFSTLIYERFFKVSVAKKQTPALDFVKPN